MATNYYQDPFGAPDYSAEGMPSLLSLSNLESLGRGSVAGLLDLPYFFEGMLMGDQDPCHQRQWLLLSLLRRLLAGVAKPLHAWRVKKSQM